MTIELMAVCDSCHKSVPAVDEHTPPEGWYVLTEFTDKAADLKEWFFCSLFCVASGLQELAKKEE